MPRPLVSISVYDAEAMQAFMRSVWSAADRIAACGIDPTGAADQLRAAYIEFERAAVQGPILSPPHPAALSTC